MPASAELDYACLDPIVEARAIWIDAGAVPKTPDEIRKLVRAYHAANLNVLFPEVICRGYAVYPSNLLARDPRFAGACDPLPVIIREAHKLGMEVHPWVWVFRAGYTKDRGAILTAHPEWAELGSDGNDLSPNGALWICPAVPAARDLLAALFAELVTCYDIDGVHLDYIRYEVESPVPYGYSDASRALFAKQYGIDPLDIDDIPIHQYEWRKFRERQINTFVQRIALQTRSIKPNVKLSAAVGPIPNDARRELMQNWVNWLDNKWLDFIVPLSYDSDDEHFRRVVMREKAATGTRSIVISGIGSKALRDVQPMVRQIAISREAAAEGQALFAASYFKETQAAPLASGPYAHPSALPFRNPRQNADALCRHADESRSRGDRDLANYLASRARDLAAYASYQEARIGYIRPTPPP